MKALLKVLLDVNVSRELGAFLVEALGLETDAVAHAVDEGWKLLDNGALQAAAVDKDYTHLVTQDTAMAQRHAALMPVIAIDNPDHGNMGREHNLPSDVIVKHRRSLAIAIGDELLHNTHRRHDYHAVPRRDACRASPCSGSSTAGTNRAPVTRGTASCASLPAGRKRVPSPGMVVATADRKPG